MLRDLGLRVALLGLLGGCALSGVRPEPQACERGTGPCENELLRDELPVRELGTAAPLPQRTVVRLQPQRLAYAREDAAVEPMEAEGPLAPTPEPVVTPASVLVPVPVPIPAPWYTPGYTPRTRLPQERRRPPQERRDFPPRYPIY